MDWISPEYIPALLGFFYCNEAPTHAAWGALLWDMSNLAQEQYATQKVVYYHLTMLPRMMLVINCRFFILEPVYNRLPNGFEQKNYSFHQRCKYGIYRRSEAIRQNKRAKNCLLKQHFYCEAVNFAERTTLKYEDGELPCLPTRICLLNALRRLHVRRSAII